MLPFLTLDALAYRTPDGRPLFDNLTLAFGGERTGLVGANGAGKTTLLRLMVGELAPAAGAVARRGRLGMLRQTRGQAPGALAADDLGVTDDLARLDRIAAGVAMAEDFEVARWALAAEIESALASVGLAGMDLSRPVDSLSGGEATRLALARLLIEKPDVLLLDEPTNHLDRDARGVVARIIADWPGGVVVVSHDRDLLRRMDRTVELSGLGARVYGGNYDLYVARRDAEAAAKARDLDAAALEARRVAREVQAAREMQDRRDASGRRARDRGDQPKMVLDGKAARAERTRAGQQRLADRRRTDAAANLEAARARVEFANRLDFDLPSCGLAAAKTVLAFDEVSFGWPGAPRLIERLSFRMTGPERLAVVGPNGAGKSSLIGLAVGELTPSSGRVTLGARAVLLDQRAALLDDGQSLLENYRRLNPSAGDNAAHAALARFLFRNTAGRKRAGDLSGGERLRAALACVLMGERPPQLVILDEPTNHLDLDSIAAVESAVAAYDGAVLIVSHDEDVLAAVGVSRRVCLSAP